jgi:hypothetical protein
MSTQIIPLKCPSCGNTSNIAEKELRFGYEFKCSHCLTTSILIVDRQLYIPQPNERICPKCGRVGNPSARFCQCGTALVRRCINPACIKEFPIDHKRCDYCGWPQTEDTDISRNIVKVFDNVWYRPDENKWSNGELIAYKDSGRLIVYTDALLYRTKVG